MICDKCGFEHNNKSVCPKCGARVIFVNEDYLRRKKEYEESRKNGGKLDPLSGVMHSTKEEYDMRHGKDSVVHYSNNKKKGESEMTSLSFATIKSRAISIVGALSNFYRKHLKKKRGKDNPIIRDLHFAEDEDDESDISGMVVSHKIYKSKIKYVLIGVVSLIFIAVMVIVAANIIKNRDRSKVFYFDGKYGYYAKDTVDALFGDIEGLNLVCYKDGNALAYNDKAIYVYKNKKTDVINAENAEIITYSDNLKLIIYIDNDIVKFYSDGKIIESEIEPGISFTNECMTSPLGEYFVLTAQKVINDVTSYAIYYGTMEGEYTVISEDEYEKNILSLADNGTLLYIDMETAEYGIINGKTLKCFDGEKNKIIEQNVDRYKKNDEKGYIFYVSKDGKLIRISEKNPGDKTEVDDKVVDFAEDGTEKNDCIYYVTEDVCYRADANTLKKEALFKASYTAITIYEYGEENELYYEYMNDMYQIQNKSSLSKGTKILVVKDNSEILTDSKNKCIYLVDKGDNLYRLDEKQKILDTDIKAIKSVENGDEYVYIKDDKIYYKKEMIGDVNSISFTSRMIYSGKCIYYIDKNNILWSFEMKKKDKKSYGNVIFYQIG